MNAHSPGSTWDIMAALLSAAAIESNPHYVCFDRQFPQHFPTVCESVDSVNASGGGGMLASLAEVYTGLLVFLLAICGFFLRVSACGLFLPAFV